MATTIGRNRLRNTDADMDITPMIDITFLLLIFFLVASRMDPGVTLTLPEAQHGTAVTTKNSAVLSLKATDGDRADLYEGEVLTPEHRLESADLVEEESAIVAYIQQQFSEGKQQVLLRAEKSVKHRDVHRVMTAVGKVDGAKIYIAVLEPR